MNEKKARQVEGICLRLMECRRYINGRVRCSKMDLGSIRFRFGALISIVRLQNARYGEGIGGI